MSEQQNSKLDHRPSDLDRIRELEETIKDLSLARDLQQANETRLIRAQRMALVGDWQMDLRTFEQEWSAPLYEIFGIPTTVPASYDAFKSCLHPDDHDETVRRQDQMVALGQPFSSEFRIQRPDGEVRYIKAEFGFEYDDKGVPVKIVGIDQDISKAKEFENALIEAKIRAESAAKAKTDFLAHMSHELRTPLNAIIGFSDAISSQVFGPINNDKYLNYIENINDSGSHLLDLINDILDLSAIEAGWLDLELVRLDLATIIEPSINFLMPRAEVADIKITTRIDDDRPDVRVDPRRTKQILLNLLSNAVKYTADGGRVEVSLGKQGDDHLLLAVSDTGHGMNDKEIALAMTPFQQSNPRVNNTVEGTGLGLPLTERLVKAHGGSLEIDSTPGKGTTVRVTFPV